VFQASQAGDSRWDRSAADLPGGARDLSWALTSADESDFASINPGTERRSSHGTDRLDAMSSRVSSMWALPVVGLGVGGIRDVGGWDRGPERLLRQAHRHGACGPDGLRAQLPFIPRCCLTWGALSPALGPHYYVSYRYCSGRMARIVRGQVLSIRNQDVQAAKAIGVRTSR